MRLRSIEQLEIGDILLCLEDCSSANEGDILTVDSFEGGAVWAINITNSQKRAVYPKGFHYSVNEDTTETIYIFNILKRGR